MLQIYKARVCILHIKMHGRGLVYEFNPKLLAKRFI